MENIIETNDISVETLKKALEEANYEFSVDKDGDLYVSNDFLEIGTFIRFNTSSNLILLFTFAQVKKGVSESDMFKFVNTVNSEIVRPQFYAVGSESDGFYLYGRYSILTQYGVDKRAFILSLVKFSSAFMAGLRLDKNDVFFD